LAPSHEKAFGLVWWRLISRAGGCPYWFCLLPVLTTTVFKFNPHNLLALFFSLFFIYAYKVLYEKTSGLQEKINLHNIHSTQLLIFFLQFSYNQNIILAFSIMWIAYKIYLSRLCNFQVQKYHLSSGCAYWMWYSTR
jgi:hypothetical protein